MNAAHQCHASGESEWRDRGYKRSRDPAFEKIRHDCELLPAVGSAQAVVFPDGDAHHSGRLRQLLLDALEHVARQILPGWHELAVSELRYVEIDVAVVEAVLYLLLEDPVEDPEINDESGLVVDWTADGDVAHVAVPMKVRPRAGAKGAGVFLIAPLRPAVAMSG